MHEDIDYKQQVLRGYNANFPLFAWAMPGAQGPSPKPRSRRSVRQLLYEHGRSATRCITKAQRQVRNKKKKMAEKARKKNR